MTIKKCKKCGNILPIEQFPFHNRRLNTHVAYCVECFKEKRKERRLNKIEVYKKRNLDSYKRHKIKRIQKQNKDKTKIWSRTKRLKIQDEWREWKSTLKCTLCSENDASCLEFHHTDPSTKDGLISKMKFSKKKLAEELKKCVVLCSNCHRKLHYHNIKLIT